MDWLKFGDSIIVILLFPSICHNEKIEEKLKGLGIIWVIGMKVMHI